MINQSEPGAARARRLFWALWSVVLAVKVAVAIRLPLFVDEAFYWQEGQHPAAAYSDLPGLTAWLTRLGVEVGGPHPLALRLPFLLIAALVPLMLVRITRRTFGESDGWRAGTFALLVPLVGSLGLLALPDAALALATLLCMDAGACLLRRVDARHALELAFGLALGALSHYRFIAVIAVGFLALLATPDGRRVLRDARVLIAIALGAAAWTPLVWWNYDNADAGLRFQLVDRHPWAFHASGLWFIAIQALLVTPLLFVALLSAGRDGMRSPLLGARWFAMLGLLVVAGFFALGFFADTERVSFHWPLPGFLALLPLLPRLLDGWPAALRRATAATAGAGLLAVLGYYVAVSIPDVRARAAAEKWYPANFAGWDTVAAAVREELRAMPAGSRVVADNFKLGAELGFALGDPRIAVLDHPLNAKHGRAPQLRLWGLDARAGGDVLLVASSSDVKFVELVDRYQYLCARFGPLPPPRVVSVDHGAQRMLLMRLPARRREGACIAPAVATIALPAAGARVASSFPVEGWAIKDGTGVAGVVVTLDGRPVGAARYGIANDWVARFFGGRSRDPQLPNVAFEHVVDAGAARGRHWLGIEVLGRDGSRERMPEIPVDIVEPGRR